MPTAQGSPGWVSGLVTWSATLMADHLVVLNMLFALTQLAITVGLLVPRTRKPALASSIVWALLVWWLGGGPWHGVRRARVGANGPAGSSPILYALIAVMVWPRTRHKTRWWPPGAL